MTEVATGAAPEAAPDLAPDLLKGIRQIAGFLDESERRTHYMLEQNQLPAYRIGHRWYARKSTLIKRIEQLEAEAMSDAGTA